jgi:acetyl esterase/lipase
MNKGRKGMAPLAQLFARQKYVGIAVSYRCKPEDAFPAPIQDVECAIRWLRTHADQYKIDKDRIGVVGFSGGGALACLLGMKSFQDDLDNKEMRPEPFGGVQAVVSFYVSSAVRGEALMPKVMPNLLPSQTVPSSHILVALT